MTTNSTPPTITRRNHGRGHSYHVNGEKWDGVTTILNKGYPKPAIAGWAAKAAAQEVLDYWADLMSMMPSERYERIRTAPDRDRDAAARRGTEVHAYASRIIHDEDVEVPDELVGHVDAYIQFLDDWDVKQVLVEAPLANLEHRYCGTLDTVADLADGNRWLLDLKTTRSGVYRESALQLVAYRNAQWVVAPPGGPAEVIPMPGVDRCGVIWLKADRSYEFVPVDAGDQTFQVFLDVQRIAVFGYRDDILEAPIRAEMQLW